MGLLNTIQCHKEPLHTDGGFYLRKGLHFGQSAQDVLAKWGKPEHKVKLRKGVDIEIFMYRLKVGGMKTKCEIHFIDNRLYHFCYRFRRPEQEQKKRIYNIVEFKYLTGAEVGLKNGSVVEDKNGNWLSVEDKFDFVVNYVADDEVVRHLLEFEIDLYTARHEKKQRKYHVELLHTL